MRICNFFDEERRIAQIDRIAYLIMRHQRMKGIGKSRRAFRFLRCSRSFWLFGKIVSFYLRMCFCIRVITQNVQIPTLLKVVNSGAVIGEAVAAHGTIHIALRSLDGFSQGRIVQFTVKPIFKVMIGHNPIGRGDRRGCQCGIKLIQEFLMQPFVKGRRIEVQSDKLKIVGCHDNAANRLCALQIGVLAI